MLIARYNAGRSSAGVLPLEDTLMKRPIQCITAAALLLPFGFAAAKPIAFARGTTVMAEYGAGTMEEMQAFYAPRYFYSVGGGHLALDSDIDRRSRDITYVRVNYLVKRWNLESSQANVFAWGGLGRANLSESSGDETAWNAGVQLDYETRRVYGSLKTDLHEGATFSNRVDTLQFGLAPYEHDYDNLATWFVVQGRRITGGIHDGTEVAFLLRFFKGPVWLEAGATTDGKLQAMAMINF
jgi:hypothetical protein